MRKRILLLSVPLFITGCSIKPVELPQQPFAYNPQSSVALSYAEAMGLVNAVDSPKGHAEELLKERQETMLESEAGAALTGYVISFAFAKALGFPTSLANDLASDTAEDQFIMGAGTTKQPIPEYYNQTAFYLPYELAGDKDSAREYAFNYFKTVMTSIGMTLEEVDAELEYGVGHEFSHPMCDELKTGCRYMIRINEPVVAYAPKVMGGYKAWVWSIASRNAPSVGIYTVANWSDIGTFSMDKITKDKLKIQDTFLKPLDEMFPKWAVKYKAATYNEPPKVEVEGVNYMFELPSL